MPCLRSQSLPITLLPLSRCILVPEQPRYGQNELAPSMEGIRWKILISLRVLTRGRVARPANRRSPPIRSDFSITRALF
jgi:hypothetical protein